MTQGSDQDVDGQDVGSNRREALLKEYGEVAGNFRLLTDIRFRLLAFLPIAAGAATALLSAGSGRDGPSEARALVLSLFGLLITVGLVTYNDRNDQHYDALVGRAASIEWQLGLFDGAFANRPTSWFDLNLPGVRWKIDHRGPVTLIYGSSVGLWIFSACVAVLQLVWGNHSAPRGVLAAAIVPAIAVPVLAVRSIKDKRKQTAVRMRADAAEAVKIVVESDLRKVAEDPDFLELCSKLSGVRIDDARARGRFYSKLPSNERRQFMPNDPAVLRAAHFVALISDLPAEWIDDCYRQRRKELPDRREQAEEGPITPRPNEPKPQATPT